MQTHHFAIFLTGNNFVNALWTTFLFQLSGSSFAVVVMSWSWSNVKLHMRRAKLQFESIYLDKARPLGQTSNLIRITFDLSASHGRSKFSQTYSLETNDELIMTQFSSFQVKFDVRTGPIFNLDLF